MGTYCAEVGLDAQLVHLLNDDADVVRDDLAEDFVHLRRPRLVVC